MTSTDSRYELLVQSVQDYGLVMLDPEGYVLTWNPGAERITGYQARDIVGRHFSLLYAEEDRAAGQPDRVLHTAATQGHFRSEVLRIHRDGCPFWAQLQVGAIHDADGQLIGFTSVSHDITERKQAELRLEETRAQLFQSQKVEALGQLTGGIAHDFNNLLQGITGALDVIAMRLESGDSKGIDRFVHMALESSQRAAHLINRLLAFARQQPLEPQYVNVNRLIENMTELLVPTVGKQVNLQLALAPDLGPARCDPNQLESALLNLVINARDAMPDGGVLTIRTGQAMRPGGMLTHRRINDPPDPYLCLQVADTGIGMPPEVSARAFDPFFTTKPKGQGTGLGLSMTHGFVVQSHGVIQLDSKPGRGTVVTLYLPCYERRGPGRETEGADTARRAASDTGLATILLVESEARTREEVAARLRARDYRVFEADDGRTGLATLESAQHIDLVITDIGLPELDGLRMVKTARRWRPELKALLITGYGVPRQACPIEHADMMPKPLDVEALLQRVDQWLAAEPPAPSPPG